MDFNQFKVNMKDLKDIVGSQTQVRTNKLKSYIENIEEFISYFETLPTPAPADPDQIELLKAVSEIKENYGVSTHQALQLIEEGVKNGSPEETDIAKDNKYLKRKLTMYELKIAKIENEFKEYKKNNKGKQAIGN